jgi:hypothetical protein
VAVGVPVRDTGRLEEVLRQMSIQYYKEEARRVKKEREKLNKNTQLSLIARHSFKVRSYQTFTFTNITKFHASTHTHARARIQCPSN